MRKRRSKLLYMIKILSIGVTFSCILITTNSYTTTNNPNVIDENVDYYEGVGILGIVGNRYRTF